MRKFENVEVNGEIHFTNKDGQIERAVITEVHSNKFVARHLQTLIDHDGVMKIYDSFISFFKTGTKTHSHYNYGNCLEYFKPISL